MAKKINIQEDSNSDEDPKLVAEVDEMMDTELPKEPTNTEVDPEDTPTKRVNIKDEVDLPPLDIFTEVPGAPPLQTAEKVKPAEVIPESTQPPANDVDEAGQTNNPPIETLKEEEVPTTFNPKQPDNYDDPKTAEAIDEIVAEESDATLDVADQKKAEAEAASKPAEYNKGHPFFWALVFIVAIIAIVIAIFLLDPSLHNPLSKIHWNSIRSHL